MSILHPQRFGLLIHQLDELPFTARYVLRHRHTGVISRRHGDTLDHRVQRLHLSLLQKDLRAAHGLCIGTRYDLVVQMDPSALYVLKNDQ